MNAIVKLYPMRSQGQKNKCIMCLSLDMSWIILTSFDLKEESAQTLIRKVIVGNSSTFPLLIIITYDEEIASKLSPNSVNNPYYIGHTHHMLFTRISYCTFSRKYLQLNLIQIIGWLSSLSPLVNMINKNGDFSELYL